MWKHGSIVQPDWKKKKTFRQIGLLRVKQTFPIKNILYKPDQCLQTIGNYIYPCRVSAQKPKSLGGTLVASPQTSFGVCSSRIHFSPSKIITGLPSAQPSYKMGSVFPPGTNCTLACSARAQDVRVIMRRICQRTLAKYIIRSSLRLEAISNDLSSVEV